MIELEKIASVYAEALLEQLRGLLDSSTGGARFSSALTEKMRKAGVSVENSIRGFLSSLCPQF